MDKLRVVDDGQSSISGTISFECPSFVSSPFGQIEGHAFFYPTHGMSNKVQGAPTNKAKEERGKANVLQYIENESEESNSTEEDYVPPNVSTKPPKEELVDSDYEINPEDDNEVAVQADARQDDADFQNHVDNENVLEEYNDMGGRDGELRNMDLIYGTYLEDLVPGSEDRHCVRYFYNNFKKKNGGIVLKNLLWAAMRDTTII
ncbi:hypothetical protein M0R45_034660 [Rubus argutus]|uniref:Uncharacterized protein n=1 Tax=Rubus argutus TaxID=59490 RepID=A0AAW1VT76_RUBAR